MKLLAIINSLDRGGAEVNLIRLARDCRNEVETVVLPLRSGGELSTLATRQGVAVLPANFTSLLRCWLRPPAHVVEGWLYVGAVVASLFRLRGCAVVWNLRHVPVDLEQESRVTRLCLRIMRSLPKPARIHTNSRRAIAAHTALGIRGNYQFVPNGIDTAHYRNDPAAARAIREKLGVSDDTALVVNVARAHPHKGHRILFEAMAPILKNDPTVHLACFGSGVPELRDVASSLQLPNRQVHLCDALDDVVGAFSAANVVVNASRSESSPTAIAEAASCGAVCVATDVGDTAELLRGSGIVVAVDNAAALATEIRAALDLSPDERAARSHLARQHIIESYDASRCAALYRQSIAQIAEES